MFCLRYTNPKHLLHELVSSPIKIRSLSTSRTNRDSLSPTIRQLLANPPEYNSEGSTRGHIKAIRAFKNVGFMDICDGTIHESLSVTITNPESVLQDNKYKVGQSVEIKGQWIESRGSQKFELSYDPGNPGHTISVLGSVPENYPIQKKRSTLQFLRTLPTLRHRSSLLASVIRFRANVERKLADFFYENDVVKVSPPLITASDCEGAGEQFQIRPMNEEIGTETPFFGKNAFLTVSTQLHLEVLALSLNRVWTLTPCFRAEHSNTNRHLSEFWMLEAELCHVTELHQLTSFVENMIRSLVTALESDASILGSGSKADLVNSRYAKSEVSKVEETWKQVLSDKPWPSISYTEAISILNSIKYKGRSKNRREWGVPISTEEEKWLAGEHFRSPVFITDYPKAQKPFYMLENVQREETPVAIGASKATVACFDLIVPELGELVGGSLREHDITKLQKEMYERGMSQESMEWYLSTRENGSVPHGGFGMGFERLLAYLTAVENIRDISAFPRAPGVCPC